MTATMRAVVIDAPCGPNGGHPTACSGEATDLSSAELQGFLDALPSGHARLPVGRVYRFDEIQDAHRTIEDGTAGGELVVVLR